MNITRFTTVVGLAAASTLASLALAQDPPAAAPKAPTPPAQRDAAPRGEGAPREGAPRAGRSAGQPVSLDGSMKGINRAFKGLSGIITDPSKKDDALKMIADMQRNCAAAKTTAVPGEYLKSAADDAAKAKIQAEFHSDLRKMMHMLVDMEDAVVAGKTDEAKTILAKVEAIRDHSHKEIGVED